MAEDTKAKHYWPLDAIGNQIRKDNLVLLKVPDALCIVNDIVPARVIEQEGQQPILADGFVVLALRIPFRGGQQIGPLMCLKQPEETIIKPN